MFQIIPAVDIVAGKAVRLYQGEAGTETTYGEPFEMAQKFASQGAQWVHIVDLDAAFDRGDNAELCLEIAQKLPINVELCGGIRDDISLRRALDAGARRVNLGTVALSNPQWTEKVIHRHGSQIFVSLDVRGEELVTHGWTQSSGNLWSVLKRLEQAGCRGYVVTDVRKDGTMTGPNIDLLRKVADQAGAPVIASGGVSSLADIEALAAYESEGIGGVVIGKALYAGAFTLPEAIAAVKN